MTTLSPSPYFPKLAARIRGYEIDYGKHRVTLWLDSGECCDMAGAIEFAERRDEECRVIVCMSGDTPSTTFSKHGESWSAHGPLLLNTKSQRRKS